MKTSCKPECGRGPRLFSYCIPYDDGAAPNPFWGYCTLAICKPVIRRIAQVGDWIIGTGGKELGHNRLVYAMKVTDKMTMQEYDAWTKTNCPSKIPSDKSPKHRKGDSIYDFAHGDGKPCLRTSVHTEQNMDTDLGGQCVLISKHFYYFGDKAIELPDYLLQKKLVKQGRGHKSNSITKLLPELIAWLEQQPCKLNSVRGNPSMWQGKPDVSCAVRAGCARADEKLQSK